MEIKEVSLKDLKQIVSLEQRIFKKNAFSKELMHNLIEKDALFLKLVIGKAKKQLIGFIIAIRDEKDRANIINFVIKPKFRNKGFGSYLLQNTIDKIKKIKGIQKVVLNVQISNTAAIRMYEKFNFKRSPAILENYYQSGESAFLMELKLDSL